MVPAAKRPLGHEDENPEDQDIVYYVAPNVLMLEQRYAFPPRNSACGGVA